MTASEFDQAQAAADGVPTTEVDRNQGGCCGPCDRCEAWQFKRSCNTRRLSAGSDPSISRQRWRRYQARKCGPLEYNIYNSNFAASGYALDPRSVALADGLAPQNPPNARRGFDPDCCLLEAKYSQPTRGRAVYISRQVFVSTARQKSWLVARWNAARRSPLGRIRRLFGGMSLRRFAGQIWDKYRNEAAFQANIYNSFCESASTPYTNFLYICGESAFVRAYFVPIAGRYPKGRVVHSTMQNPNTWITNGPPPGC